MNNDGDDDWNGKEDRKKKTKADKNYVGLFMSRVFFAHSVVLSIGWV